MAPDVSVIIPMWNAAPWIITTLQSVQTQTLGAGHYEVIIVDDASTDGCGDIAEHFLAQSGTAFRLLRFHSHLGVSAARNSGLGLASADWLQFLDADDVLAPDKLRQQLASTTEIDDDVAVIYSPWQRLTADIDGTWRPSGECVSPSLSRYGVDHLVARPELGYLGPALIRRSSILTTHGFRQDLNYGEDLELLVRLATTGDIVAVHTAEPPLFYYRSTPGSLGKQGVGNSQASLNLWEALIQDLAIPSSPLAAVRALARTSLAQQLVAAANYFERVDPHAAVCTYHLLDALALRRAPEGFSLPVRALSPLLGLSRTMRLRRVAGRLHARHT